MRGLRQDAGHLLGDHYGGHLVFLERRTTLRIAARVGVAGATLVASVQVAYGGGPEGLVERGRTVSVIDGDTVYVNVWNDGLRWAVPVRLAGVNTTEAGQCHAGAAARLTTRLALDHETRLLAIHPQSLSRGRLRRTIITLRAGRYVNLASALVKRGLANPAPLDDEWAHNAEYRALAERAAHAGRGIWDVDACGRGPQEGAHIALSVHADAAGEDSQNPNGEWVTVTNRSRAGHLSLHGWLLRDAGPREYYFPPGTVVPPGRSLRLHTGKGRRHGLVHYWGSDGPRWLNASDDQRAHGDGAYLVDPDGDIRAYSLYP